MESSQQNVAHTEQSETLEDDKLERVAKVLGVSIEEIEGFSEEAIFNNIHNNYEGSTIKAGPTVNHHCIFNPLEKFVKSLEENKKLHERMVQAEKDKVSYLKKFINKR